MPLLAMGARCRIVPGLYYVVAHERPPFRVAGLAPAARYASALRFTAGGLVPAAIVEVVLAGDALDAARRCPVAGVLLVLGVGVDDVPLNTPYRRGTVGTYFVGGDGVGRVPYFTAGEEIQISLLNQDQGGMV